MTIFSISSPQYSTLSYTSMSAVSLIKQEEDNRKNNWWPDYAIPLGI